MRINKANTCQGANTQHKENVTTSPGYLETYVFENAECDKQVFWKNPNPKLRTGLRINNVITSHGANTQHKENVIMSACANKQHIENDIMSACANTQHKENGQMFYQYFNVWVHLVLFIWP